MIDEECQQLNISDCLVRHDEENPIKSVATVKYQMVQSPANFARLKCNTDLNVPPTNWLNSAFNSYGFQQALSQSTGFSSFRMAHLFPDCLGEVDVVANAENIKCLLKLPYASNCSISMMVHRIGNTLLIDDFDVHRFLLQQEDCNWTWLRSFICEHILTRLNDTERNFLKNQPTTTSRTDAAVQQRSLLSKFLYHSLSTSTVSKSELNDALDIKLATNQSAKHLQYGPLLPEPNIEENVPDPKHTKHTYNRNVIWTFEDIRMLIGTDMAIFGGASRPCISLRLRDMRQPINVLTGIDYWLDNLMCNVPEVVMCYHLDGLVQKYEIIKTEDLPFMENSKFQPNVIRNVAQNILSFLKQNATKSGHTYWLFKGRKDDVVKLYDLTSLMNSATNEFGGQAPKPTSTNDCTTDAADATNQENDDKNPFTVPVAMLLYKVARNMKNSAKFIKAKQAGSIKALLDNCIKLLPKEQYPQIVASSYYLLSDLHIPSGTDPMSPKFDHESNKAKDSPDDDDDDEEEDVENSDDSGSTSGVSGVEEQQQQQSIPQEHQCPTKKVWSDTLPPPLSGTVDERCSSALQYIADGLNCLQYFSMNEAKLAKEREEIAKQTEKMRIIQEEQNPNMAKPYQAIPLPYEKIRQNLDAEAATEAAGGVTTKEKSKKEPSTSTSSSDQLFVGKPRPPIVQSWNVHLKLLFFEKSCLIYAILTEQAYQRKEYGTALKYISIAMKYYDIVSMHQFYCMSVGQNYRTNLLARAGDCYFNCAQDFSNINTHLNEYNIRRAIDEKIEKELEKDEKDLPSSSSSASGAEIQFVKPIDNLEQLILISISYYESALKYTDGKGSRDEILGRIGSVLNELGIKYMNWSQEQYQKLNNTTPDLADPVDKADNADDDAEDAKKPQKSEDIYLSLAIKSYNCLLRGIAIFEEIQDNANLAILLCNMGRFMRFRAHLERDKEFNYKKSCYESAFTSYQRALTILDSKKQNPYLWDLVTWELSTGKFTLAKYMSQQVQHGRENDEIDQEIIDLLMGSLKLCDTETLGPKQIMYTIRSGLIYHKLGIIYGRQYQACNNNNNRKKKLLNLCRLYYEKSVKVFQSIEAPIEFIEVQNDRLNFQNTLFEGCQTPSQKLKSLQTAIAIACETISQFQKIEKLDANSDDDPKRNAEILKEFELHVQKLLKHLIQVSINKQSDANSIAEYKRIYSLSLLSSAQKNDFQQFSTHLKNLLQTVQQSIVISC